MPANPTLFDDKPTAPVCPDCDRPGYCPVHGNYNPPTEDLEIQQLVAMAAAERRTARRVLRKPLE